MVHWLMKIEPYLREKETLAVSKMYVFQLIHLLEKSLLIPTVRNHPFFPQYITEAHTLGNFPTMTASENKCIYFSFKNAFSKVLSNKNKHLYLRSEQSDYLYTFTRIPQQFSHLTNKIMKMFEFASQFFFWSFFNKNMSYEWTFFCFLKKVCKTISCKIWWIYSLSILNGQFFFCFVLLHSDKRWSWELRFSIGWFAT